MPQAPFSRYKELYMGGPPTGEDAVDFFDVHGHKILTVVDAEPSSAWGVATQMRLPIREDDCWAIGENHQHVIELTADQVAELGRFCLEQFCQPRAQLATIENAAAFVRAALESWNERARADEEHPPYDDLVRRLDEIKSALDRLEWLRRLV